MAADDGHTTVHTTARCAACGWLYLGYWGHYCAGVWTTPPTYERTPETPRSVPCATCSRQPRVDGSLDCDDCTARHAASLQEASS